jgi:hypothetical protein
LIGQERIAVWAGRLKAVAAGLVLGALYLIVFTPVGFLRRTLSKTSTGDAPGSYWSEVSQTRSKFEDLY